ncbi:MAG TPA: MBL fold metallo-hydrolase [Polyangiaceae bacterium]
MSNRFDIRFWGVRGSIASPGAETAKVGGNTSSLEVRCGDTRILLDAGTGLRRLGDALLAEGKPIDATLLLSHFHWDHIQGLPFFVPAYVPTTKLAIVGGNVRTQIRDAMVHQMSDPVFPVGFDELGAQITTKNVRASDTFEIGDAKVKVGKGNHPGGVLAYRIEHGGRAIVYATDTEHFACVDPDLRALAKDADVLIYDAQYTPEEYAGKIGRSRVGWGHSTYVAACELAQAAGVGKLVLFHHDPQRSDAGVAEIEQRSQALFTSTVAAREGLLVDVFGRPLGGEQAA